MTPIVIIAFSNDKDNYLDMIVRERKSIFKSLQNHHDKAFIQVHQEMNTSLEDIFETFNRYKNQVEIFHYGGHANGSSLQFESTGGTVQIAYSGGLAEMLGLQVGLKLVFLNGCATKGQVDLLLKSGVKAVIATSVPINDVMAVEFAEQFYQSLSNQASISDAYIAARAFVLSKYGNKKQIRDLRDIDFEEPLSTQTDELPWGLYLMQQNKTILEWKLPQISTSTLTIQSKGIEYKKNSKVHSSLLNTLVQNLPKHDSKVKNMLEIFKLEKNEENKNNVNLFIVNSFPTPIGLQMRKLFANKAINSDRLQQLLDTYNATIELICYIMLSQLWDEKVKNQHLIITENERVVFNSFFSLNKLNYKTYNYYNLLGAIQKIFNINKLQPFLHELKEFDFLNLELQTTINNMQGLKAIDFDQIPPSELERLCIEAEENLSVFLEKFLFIVEYKFLIIKNIELIKERHKNVKYNHKTLLLKQVEGKSAHDSSDSLFDNFSDNKSIVISRNLNSMNDFLNLSHFVIDEDINEQSSAKLFYFCYTDNETGSSVYRFLDSAEELQINSTNFPETYHLIGKFKKDLFLENFSENNIHFVEEIDVPEERTLADDLM